MTDINEFIEFVRASLEKITQYTSGFDNFQNEFVSTDTPVELALGNKIILFDSELEYRFIKPVEIIGMGTTLVPMPDGTKVPMPTYTIETSSGETEQYTENELKAMAVTPRQYYTRLAEVERHKTLDGLEATIKNELEDLELKLDKIFFDQECAINAEAIAKAKASGKSIAPTKKSAKIESVVDSDKQNDENKVTNEVSW